MTDTKLKKLILVGGGSYGREVADGIHQFDGYNTQWSFHGFVDNESQRFGIADMTIGLIKDYQPKDDELFVCTLPDPKIKREYTSLLESRGAEFTTLIHKLSTVSSRAVIGRGCIIGCFCGIAVDVRIGNHTSLNSHIGIGHDSILGDYCHLNAFTLVGGFSHLADGVTVHPHASILPRKRIGEGAVIGVGSVVIRSVKRLTTVFGNPAKIIKTADI